VSGPVPSHTRRALLRSLAALPVAPAWAQSTDTGLPWLYRSLAEVGDLDPGLPRLPSEVAGVAELERLAEQVLPAAHFGYIYAATGNGESKQANADAYTRYGIPPRRLQGLAGADSIDTRLTLFGRTWPTPIYLCPTAGHVSFHPEGEIATARGAQQVGALQMLSSLTTTELEKVNEARGEAVWFQLYPTNDERVRYELVDRAEAAGCPAIVLTVDDIGGRGSEISAPFYRRDTRDCTACHRRELGRVDFLRRKAMFLEYRERPGFDIIYPALDFDHVERLRERVRVKLLIKGIMSAVDAERCAAIGVDGIVVSNHGGRSDSGGIGTLDALPAIAAGLGGRLPILLDGGVRRGTDALKALALGATAVGIGRPYLWGLASFGAEGVALTVQLLTSELKQALLQAGVPSLQALSPEHLQLIR
jgi:4-hydroxymandelate oxidase